MPTPVSLAAIETAAQDLASKTDLTIEEARQKVTAMMSSDTIAEVERRARLNIACYMRELQDRMRRHMGVGR